MQGSADRFPARRVLVAEDEARARELLVIQLDQVGCEVLACRNGAEALEGLRSFRPEAMVLDLGMPRVDGFETLRAMGDGPPELRTPTLVLTARGGRDDVALARSLGAQDYLLKPYPMEQLLIRVARLLVWSGRMRRQTGAPLVLI